MSSLRLAMVTPRYWPLAGERERTFSDLADEFTRLGSTPTILTASWDSSWPTAVSHRERPVIRVPSSPRGGWSTLRYVRGITRFLRRNSEFDVIYVDGLRHDAYGAVVATRGRSTVVVLRHMNDGRNGDCVWQAESHLGKRIRRHCQQATAIVVSNQQAADELVAAGYAQDRIALIRPGVALGNATDAAARHAARMALGEVNRDLAVPEFAPVVLSIERLKENSGLRELIHSWQAVVERWPSARLWIVGDGPARRDLYETVIQSDADRHIFLPGSFDDLEELLQAADIYVAPSTTADSDPTCLAAMAAGLPVIAVATPARRAMMDPDVSGCLIPECDSAGLSAAFFKLLESTNLRLGMGEAARRQVADKFTLTGAAEEHLALFARLRRARGIG